MEYLPPRTLAHLALIVANRLYETATLEFKRQLPASGKNDDLARDLAAMANAEGGLIIYGIGERDGCASSLNPFDVATAAEKVSLVAQTLDGPVQLTATYTIPDSANPAVGYLIVTIGESTRRPHFFRGEGWGRSSTGNQKLSRRQIGELFARSDGFVQEFGLFAARPGRVKVTPDRQTRPGTHGSQDHYLVFENDGEAKVFNAAWQWTNAPSPPSAIQDPFPLAAFEPGSPLRVLIQQPSSHPAGLHVRTSWEDRKGLRSFADWPISWL